MIAPIEQQRELHDRVDKKGYPIMNPFLCGVMRSANVRINAPLCKIEPYTES